MRSAGNLTKLGANTLTLTGTLGHSGTTTVSAGTLRVNPQTLAGSPTNFIATDVALPWGRKLLCNRLIGD